MDIITNNSIMKGGSTSLDIDDLIYGDDSAIVSER